MGIERNCGDIEVVNSSGLAAASQSLPFAVAMIEQLRGGAGIRLPLAQVTEVIDGLLRGVPYFSYPVPRPFSVFRGRIDNSRPHFDQAQQFSYRPIDGSAHYGRCHVPGRTVLYGSMNLDTVLAELSPEVGDRVHVGVAGLSEEAQLNVTAIGEIDHWRRYGRPLLGGEGAGNTLNTIVNGPPTEERTRTLLVDAFFADLFALPAAKQQERKATGALAGLLLDAVDQEGKPLLDGFAYPSVAHRGGLNFALRPDSVDRALQWQQFMVFEITDYLGFGLYGRKQVASGATASAGTIAWSEHPGTDAS